MKMINVLQRLAELDEVNPNVVNEANKTKKGTKKSASEKAQSKMAGAMNKDNSNSSPASATGAGVNKMNR